MIPAQFDCKDLSAIADDTDDDQCLVKARSEKSKRALKRDRKKDKQHFLLKELELVDGLREGT